MTALYGPADLGRIPWPDTPDGDYARRYLEPMLRDGASAYIENVDTRLQVLIDGDLVMPVTVNDAQYGSCYVTSPYDHYVTYAAEELGMLDAPGAKLPLGVALAGLGGLLRLGRINKTVHVNNWMLSTNLYPALGGDRITAIRRLIRAVYPDHAIAFRSINTVEGLTLHDAFIAQGFLPVASRRLYYMRPFERAFFNASDRRVWKRDGKLLDAGPYELVTPDLPDLPRVLDVYNQLYLDKYTRHNPRFTPAFIELAWREGTLELRALRHRETGQIDGALGFFTRHGMMTTPLFGYDTHLPASVGLYRMLSMVTYREAQSRDLILNQSSGAGEFKRSRGGRPNVEHTLVDVSHLPFDRQATWHTLAAAINGIAVPLMEARNV